MRADTHLTDSGHRAEHIVVVRALTAAAIAMDSNKTMWVIDAALPLFIISFVCQMSCGVVPLENLGREGSLGALHALWAEGSC